MALDVLCGRDLECLSNSIARMQASWCFLNRALQCSETGNAIHRNHARPSLHRAKRTCHYPEWVLGSSFIHCYTGQVLFRLYWEETVHFKLESICSFCRKLGSSISLAWCSWIKLSKNYLLKCLLQGGEHSLNPKGTGWWRCNLRNADIKILHRIEITNHQRLYAFIHALSSWYLFAYGLHSVIPTKAKRAVERLHEMTTWRYDHFYDIIHCERCKIHNVYSSIWCGYENNINMKCGSVSHSLHLVRDIVSKTLELYQRHILAEPEQPKSKQNLFKHHSQFSL